MTPPVRTEAGGILLEVRLTPRGGRDAIDGVATLSNGRRVFAARVRAVPEKGAANEALLALVAATLQVPCSSVSIAAGHAARLKTVRIAGDAASLAARVAALAG